MQKIVFYIDIFIVGGRERVILNIMNGLKSLGMSTELVIEQDKNIWNEAVNPIILEREAKSFLGRSFLLKEIVEKNDVFVSNLGFFNYNIDIATYSKTTEFIGFLYYPSKILSLCHTSIVDLYLSKNKKLSHYLNSNIFGVISICNAIKDIINREYRLDNIKSIYNPIEIFAINEKMNENLDEKIDYKYILAVGRLAKEKNFESLINAYGKSKLKNDNVKLVIIGEGGEKNKLQKTISKLKLKSNVLLLGNKNNPFKYMKNALFMVMSSKFEGFPMALGECLATGTPVVSYDLQTGPNEIIVHEHNGLLVENQNEKRLTEAIDRLYTDKALYEKCKSNAQESVKKFDVSVVAKEWETLINDISNNKETYKLKTDDVNYKNPHGEFTEYELLYYINSTLNYKNVLEYFEETIVNEPSAPTNRQDIIEFERNIYGFVDRYNLFFKCSNDIKNVVEINIASNIISAVRNSNLLNNTAKEDVLSQLTQTMNIYDKEAFNIELLIEKNNVTHKLNHDKWYKFSKLSKKDKFNTIIKMTANYIIIKTSKKSVLISKIFKKFNIDKDIIC